MKAKSPPKLSEQAIAGRIGEPSLEKGRSYSRSGAILDPRRQGATLKALCEGSMPQPYRVQATLDEGRVADAKCSCPVGAGGHCKHVAALLLTYSDRPEAFVEVEETEASLGRRSKPELIALIKQMLAREPDLEVLLETPLPDGRRRKTPVNPDTYRRQAAGAFRNFDFHEWGSGRGVAQEIGPIVQIGRGFLEQEDYASASAVFEGVLGAIAEGYHTADDEGGDLFSKADDCVEGLDDCLPRLKEDPARREAVLRVLFEAFDFSRSFGELSHDIPGVIAGNADDDERRAVIGWIRGAMAEAKSERSESGRNYRLKAYGDFLLELEGDEIDDEAFLAISREAGLTRDLVDRLLTLGRVDEATAELERAEDVLSLADLFISHKQAAIAERVVAERAETARDWTRVRLWDWLKARATARRDKAAERELAERLFRESPSLERYKELRKLATKARDWDGLRPKLLDQLRKAKGDDSNRTLIQIHLDEGEIDEALAIVKAVKSPSLGYGSPLYYGAGMSLEVAKAAEATHPRDAIDLYRKHAESLIDQRSRSNYQEACRYLARVRGLYVKLGEQTEWDRYVADLRVRNSSLRALKEELASAKL